LSGRRIRKPRPLLTRPFSPAGAASGSSRRVELSAIREERSSARFGPWRKSC
jgi:hypothetical protein